MLNSSILKKFTLFFVGFAFLASCDKDFDGIGSDIVGDDHSDFEKEFVDVNAFSIKTGVVETTNLPVNPLGIFSNGKFGKTTANFVTQLELATENPVFKNVPLERLKTVILKVPYFSHVEDVNSDGVTTYKLDSIYGDRTATMKLSVYENGYYMRDFDPNNNLQAQKFYSDQDAVFDAAKRGTDDSGNSVPGGLPLNNASAVGQNTAFVFSPAEISIPASTEDGAATKEAPQMRMELNKNFFHNKIISTPSSNLVNNNIFKNHFKGLYFQIEEISGGALSMLDFSKGTITLTYDDDKVTIIDGVETVNGTVEKTLVLNLKGNTASLLKHTATPESNDYEIADGIDKLYLKGGEGSVAYIDLFAGDNAALEELRVNAITNNWLINEANLVFNVEQTDMINTIDPNRLYVYDANNSRPLLDYSFDGTENRVKPKYAKTYHDGIAQLTGVSGDSDRKATKYRVRITEHVKNLIYKDSTNVRLGLAITETIANIGNLSVKIPPTQQTKKIPLTSVMSPLGTIISGSTSATPADKRIKLEITFTKPN